MAPRQNSPTPDSRPIETIRLSARDRRRFIEQINTGSKAVPSQMDRRSLRVEYNIGQVTVSVTHPNRQVVTYNVLPRNLSRRGIAFVHGQFIYVGSPCEVMLPTRGGGCWVPTAGKVVGCRHLSGLMHEVSVAFRQEIDLAEFVTLTSEQLQRLQRELSGLSGAAEPVEAVASDAVRHALIVVDGVSMRHLITLWLQQLGHEGREADVFDAQRLVGEQGFDLVVVDLMADGAKGAQLIRKLRAAGYRGGILAVCDDGREQLRKEAKDAGAGAFLELPFTHAALQEALASIRKTSGEQPVEADAIEPLYPSIVVDPQIRPLLEEFVNGLGEFARHLAVAVKCSDHASALFICRKLKGAGGSFGFESITETAKLAILCMEQEERDVKAIRQRVDELVVLLQRARVA